MFATMLISIIVPVYNSANCLKSCIDSVLAQTYTEWELILVDDGSTDGSANICDDYANRDSRILSWHLANGGVGHARNFGLSQAHGDWITFCDSDDEMPPRALAAYGSCFIPGVDLIRGGFERVKNGNTTLVSTPKCVVGRKEDIISKCSSTRYEAYLWNSCFRKEIIGDIRFNEKISWCEDHLFTFSAIKNAKSVMFIPEVVYRYYAPEVTDGSSFGKNLSSRYINPDMIITEALAEMKVKKECVAEYSKDFLDLIRREFEYKVRLAIRYAVIGNHICQAFILTLRYLPKNLILPIKLLYYIKIAPILKLNIK